LHDLSPPIAGYLLPRDTRMGKRFNPAFPYRIFVETTGSTWGGCLLSPIGLDELPLTRGHRRYIFEILHSRPTRGRVGKIKYLPLSRSRERVGVRVGYNFTPSLCHYATHPVFPDLCKASLSAFMEILMMGCRCATVRDFFLSPGGEERNLYST